MDGNGECVRIEMKSEMGFEFCVSLKEKGKFQKEEESEGSMEWERVYAGCVLFLCGRRRRRRIRCGGEGGRWKCVE